MSFLSLIGTVQCVFTFPSTELDALHDLYTATKGELWTWYPEAYLGNIWNFTQPEPNPCTQNWQGVTCTSDCEVAPCHVLLLELVGYGMNGQLPSSLDQLSHLTTLDIGSNYHLDGTIPSSIGSISTLLVLRLWYNQLTGSIPSTIYQLNNLQELKLSGNQFDTLPLSNELYTLTKLKTLLLDYNNFYGTISSNISQLSSLQRLDLSGNQLTGILPDSLYSITTMSYFSIATNNIQGSISDSIRKWTSAISINYGVNSFAGTIPYSICEMRDLEVLDLHLNDFHGNIPECIDLLINLNEIHLNNNEFSGTIPLILMNLTNIELLDLDRNYFTGSIPFTINQLMNCTQINMESNRLTGTIPSSIGDLKRLKTLILANNRLGGSIPNEIVNCNNLTTLNLGSNMLIGSIPYNIGNLQHLQNLQLDENGLIGTLPDSITSCKRLINLVLSNNSLHGTLPDTWERLEVLQSLQLNANAFTGEIPDSLYSCRRLETIDFNQNQFLSTISNTINRLENINKIAIADNFIYGTIPDSIGLLTTLQVLELNLNPIQGSIPYSIGNLKNLVNISIADTLIEGILPNTFGNLHRLVHVVLSGNRLNGTIPYNIGNLTRMAIFRAPNNRFTGNIPLSIVECRELTDLDLSNNFLTGTIPNEFGKVQKISNVILEANQLTGTVPHELFSSFLLTTLDLEFNLLTGPFPTNITHSLKLLTIDFGGNLLTGKIPEEIGKLKHLQNLYLMFNEFHNSLPQTLYNLNELKRLYFFHNYITNTISNTIINLQSLEELYAYTNLLTGTIPKELFQIDNLNALYLYSNNLYGTLPWNSLSNRIVRLLEMFLDNNMLSGTLPSNINIFPTLLSLNLSSNEFTGSLPSTVKQLIRLDTVDISHNHFTGILEDKFVGSKRLRLLFANNNAFHGLLQNIFNITTQRSLRYVDLSSNQLSGTLSDTFFLYQNMSSFAVVKNCLSGSIPQAICTNPRMVSLALDGLHSAEYCQQHILPYLHAYVLDNTISGTIPSCLFEMPYLNTLHLSGNGISGTLPDNVIISPSLSDLSLSHNELTGSIPLNIQDHNWENLDLSFNKLTGYLKESQRIVNNSWTLDLEVNRLSGRIPSTLLEVDTINILRGNLFECKFLRFYRSHYLPHRDSNYRGYQCGSNTVDAPLYIWVMNIVITIILALLIFYRLYKTKLESDDDNPSNDDNYDKTTSNDRERPSQVQKVIRRMSHISFNQIQEWWSVFRGDKAMNSFGNDMVAIRRLCGSWTAIVVLILLPLYALFHVYFSTYEYTYGWFISLAYVGGFIPAITALAVFICVLILVEFNIQRLAKHFPAIGIIMVETYEKNAFSTGKAYNTHNTNTTTTSTISRDNSSSSRSSDHKMLVDNTKDLVAKLSLSRLSATLSMGESSKHDDYSMSTIDRDGSSISTLTDIKPTTSMWQSSIFVSPKNRHIWLRKTKWTLISIFVILLNIVIVLGVNGAYVYSTTAMFNPLIIRFTTFLIIVFKVVWSVLIVARYVSDVLQMAMNVYIESDWISANGVSSHAFEAKIKDYERQVSQILIWLSLFNSVIAPCLAVLLVSPQCFYYMIREPSRISVSYRFFQCDGIYYSPSQGYICLGKSISTHTTSYSPAFSYSYQCTSSLLANFANIYLFRYLITGIILPIVLFFVKVIQEKITNHKVMIHAINKESIEKNPWYKVAKYLAILLPVPSRLVDQVVTPGSAVRGSTLTSSSVNIPSPSDAQISDRDGISEVEELSESDEVIVETTNPLQKKRSESDGSISVISSTNSSITSISIDKNAIHKKVKRLKPKTVKTSSSKSSSSSLSSITCADLFASSVSTHQVFVARRFANVLVGDIAIFLTFGSIYPPLAICVFIGIVSNTGLMHLMLGRFIVISRKYFQLLPFSDAIQRETAAVGSLVALSIPPVTVLATMFWSFFLFDIMGDDVGTKKAYWILFILPGCLLLTRIYSIISDYYHSHRVKKQVIEYVGSFFVKDKRYRNNSDDDDGDEDNGGNEESDRESNQRSDGIEMRDSSVTY